jgi:hypothetical protein
LPDTALVSDFDLKWSVAEVGCEQVERVWWVLAIRAVSWNDGLDP